MSDSPRRSSKSKTVPQSDDLTYLDFLHQGPSPFHVVSNVKNILKSNGFLEWDGKKALHLEQGYWVLSHNQKSILSFYIPSQKSLEEGFAISCAHTDSPALLLRLNPFSHSLGAVKAATELHGSLIQRQILDRPLRLSGMVYQRSPKSKTFFSSNSFHPNLDSLLLSTPGCVGIIPDLAIHLDREKNSLGAINPETMLSALLGDPSPKLSSDEILGKLFKVKLNDVKGFELYFSPLQEPTFAGLEGEYICGPRHDDLAMVFCGLAGFLKALKQGITPHKASVLAFFDAEETGSETSSGAHSCFLRDILKLILAQFSIRGCPLHKSFLLSCDMAHGFHPNHPAKHDDSNRPVLNQGVVIKQNANDRYSTSGYSSAFLQSLGEEYAIPMQTFVCRQDMACGSTVGPILTTKLGCLGADMGVSMWSMHSSCETMGRWDLNYAIDFIKYFFAQKP